MQPLWWYRVNCLQFAFGRIKGRKVNQQLINLCCARWLLFGIVSIAASLFPPVVGWTRMTVIYIFVYLPNWMRIDLYHGFLAAAAGTWISNI